MSGHLSPEGDAVRHLRGERRDRLGEFGERRRDDEHLRVAVVDDVRGLDGSEVRVDEGDVDARSNCTPVQFECRGVVDGDDRDVVALPDVVCAQPVREPDGRVLEFPIGERPSGRGLVHGGPVRGDGGVTARVHPYSPRSLEMIVFMTSLVPP